MSNTPIGDGLAERMSFLIECAERIAATQERTAILEILTDELKHQERISDNQEVWEALYRVARSIEARQKAATEGKR